MDSEIDGRSGNITGNDIWHDQIDTTPEFIDITDIRWQREDQMRWSFHLSDAPPPAKALDPDAQVIEYGLVFDVDWDAVPDYEVGIDNSPGGGRYRVWVTDLKANTTEKRSGPPYGALVDFSHPDEASAPTMTFTFLDGTRPPGLDSDSRLYAWASYKEHGSVVAWDYAPDFGWLAGGPMLVVRGYTASVQRGEMATLSVMAGSRQRCYVEIIYGNDPSEVTRLEERLADQLGMLSWTWRVPADTTPGTYPLNIYCSSNAAADPFREQFEVR
jgi:hypothetical protein